MRRPQARYRLTGHDPLRAGNREITNRSHRTPVPTSPHLTLRNSRQPESGNLPGPDDADGPGSGTPIGDPAWGPTALPSRTVVCASHSLTLDIRLPGGHRPGSERRVRVPGSSDSRYCHWFGEVPGGCRKPARTGPHFSTAPRECRRWLGVPPASGHGPGRAEIVVPFQLRRAGRGIAADGTAGDTAASHRGATGPGGPGGGRVLVPRHDLAGGPEPGVSLLAPGAGRRPKASMHHRPRSRGSGCRPRPALPDRHARRCTSPSRTT